MTTATWVSMDQQLGSSVPGSTAEAVVSSVGGTNYGPSPPVGTVKRFYDVTGLYGVGEFIYLPGVASLAAGDTVEYNLSAGVAAATDATVVRWAGTAGSGRPLAVATTANTASTTFSWYQIGGATVMNTSGTVAAGDPIYWQATGVVSHTAVNGKQMLGATAFSANGVPSANKAVVTLDRPHAQSQAV